MIENINNSGIDVNKVKQLLDEILTFELDNRGTQEYWKARVQIADEIFKLAQEMIELMYRLNLEFATEFSKEDLIDKINVYRNAEHNLHEIQTDIDILQC